MCCLDENALKYTSDVSHFPSLLRLFLRTFFSLTLMLGFAQAHAGAPVIEVGEEASIDFSRKAMIFLDESGALGVDAVAGLQEKFRPVLPADLQRRYGTGVVWLQATLKNTNDTKVIRWLVIGNARMDSAILYRHAGANWSSIETGLKVPPNKKPINATGLVIPVSLAAGEVREVMLRLQSRALMDAKARLWQPAHLLQADDVSLLTIAAGAGGSLIVVLGALVVFARTRDWTYLYFSILHLGVGLMELGREGLWERYLWPAALAFPIQAHTVVSVVAFVSLLLIQRDLMSLPMCYPRWNRVFLVLMAGTIAIAPISLFDYPLSNIVLSRMLVIACALSLGVAIMAWRKGDKSAGYLVLSYGLFWSIEALRAVSNMGFIHLPFTEHSRSTWSLLIATPMLLMALAERVNALRREKMDAQTQLLRIQGEMVEKLKASEQLLEARVAERTAQLQLLNGKLEVMSTTDALTGIANRRHFDTVLADEWNRAVRQGKSLALGLIDLDWFKKYNDHYGHQAGDECLRQVAKVLSEKLGRTGDLVARYGGEEFVFIAPVTDCEGALRLAQAVCQAVEGLALPHRLSDFGCVTLSIGVAALIPRRDESAELLIRRADEMLYRAKAQGRNRAVCDMPHPSKAPADPRERSFTPVIWKDAFFCGNDLIDGQHKLLVQITNELLSAMLAERSEAEVALIMVNLLAEVKQHFHDEETILRQLRFDKLDQHTAEHAQLLAQAYQLVGQFETKELTLCSLVQFLAHDVITRHILGSDLEYFALIANPVPPVTVN